MAEKGKSVCLYFFMLKLSEYVELDHVKWKNVIQDTHSVPQEKLCVLIKFNFSC